MEQEFWQAAFMTVNMALYCSMYSFVWHMLSSPKTQRQTQRFFIAPFRKKCAHDSHTDKTDRNECITRRKRNESEK